MKRYIVVGAQGEIGQAIAQCVLKNGAKLAALDLGLETAESRDRFDCQIDIRNDASVRSAIADSVAWLGGVDGFINAAGIIRRGSLFELTEQDYLDVIEVNLLGAIRMTREIAKYMRSQGSGTILHVTSVHALVGSAQRSAYAASKGGIVAFIRAAAAELGPLGLTINAIAPGPVGNGMASSANTMRNKFLNATPLNRVASLREVAAAALFLTSKEAAFISGHVMPVDGGVCSTLHSTKDNLAATSR